MLERLILAGILLVAGVIIYWMYTRQQLKNIGQTISIDPILQGMAPGMPTIVYFTTPNCIPCRVQQQPALEQLKREIAVQVVKIDATLNPDAADRWGVMSAPTTFVLDSKWTPIEVNHGVADVAKLKQQIERV